MAVGRINRCMTALTKVFCKKMYGRFAGPKKSSRNNKVIVLPRWP